MALEHWAASLLRHYHAGLIRCMPRHCRVVTVCYEWFIRRRQNSAVIHGYGYWYACCAMRLLQHGLPRCFIVEYTTRIVMLQ